MGLSTSAECCKGCGRLPPLLLVLPHSSGILRRQRLLYILYIWFAEYFAAQKLPLRYFGGLDAFFSC